jgi:hypothetical protein
VMMGESIGHPSWVGSGCRIAYFVNFLAIAPVGYLSLQ